MMAQALAPLIQREGQGCEHRVRLLQRFAAVVDDAPAPARFTGNREGNSGHACLRSNSQAAKQRKWAWNFVELWVVAVKSELNFELIWFFGDLQLARWSPTRTGKR
jgi:hypothetical protein